MDKKSSNIESESNLHNQDDQTHWKAIERWDDDLDEFIKIDETAEPRGNELRNNDTQIRVAKNHKNGKTPKKNTPSTNSSNKKRRRTSIPSR